MFDHLSYSVILNDGLDGLMEFQVLIVAQFVLWSARVLLALYRRSTR